MENIKKKLILNEITVWSFYFLEFTQFDKTFNGIRMANWFIQMAGKYDIGLLSSMDHVNKAISLLKTYDKNIITRQKINKL